MIDQIKHYYDNLSSSYDSITSGYGQWAAPEILESMIKDFSFSNSKILDIGIGTGKSIEYIYSNYEFAEIYGVDISGSMLDLCKVKFPKTKLLQGDICVISDLLPNDFDLVICCGSFELIQNPPLFFSIVSNLIKDDGLLILTFEPIILNYSPQNKVYSIVEAACNNYNVYYRTNRYHFYKVIELLSQNNFKVISTKEFQSYTSGKYDNKSIFNHILLAVKQRLR